MIDRDRFFSELQQMLSHTRLQLRATYRQLLTSDAPPDQLDRVERLLGLNADTSSQLVEAHEYLTAAI